MTDHRIAGILIPLFSLRSAGDMGRGDIGGLRAMGDLALAMGHRALQLLPIDETPPGEASPYSAMSVMAIDPRYVSIKQLHGVTLDQSTAHASLDLIELATTKLSLLREAYRHFIEHATAKDREAFRNFVDANHYWLEDYALFRVLSDRFEHSDWSRWPFGFRQHDPSTMEETRRTHAEEIDFFRFVQFTAHSQWSEAKANVNHRGVYLGGDLAFSPSAGSVEVWAHQDVFDLTRTVGAPPDAFSDEGQRWGLPMPDWSRMRAENFSLLRKRIRRARDLYDFLRVDHVVGLFRTFGFPLGEKTIGAFDPPAEEAQLAQGEEILRLIKEEAAPMRIIAEDLGVIPPFVRATMAKLGIPGYKIARWERDWSAPDAPFIDPAKYPAVALATTGTHDTDTLAEWWETIDEKERHQFLLAMGVHSEAAAQQATLSEPLLDRILSTLYASPAQLVIMPLQDLFRWKDRINVPGTVDSTNWRWRLPFDPARATDHPHLRSRIEALHAIVQRASRL